MKRYDSCIIVLCILLFAAAVCFHSGIAGAVISAGTRCVMVIIPSLYLFSVLAAFCIRTGILEIAAKPLNRFSRKFLHMDGVLLLILAFSQIAGYPVGAQLVQQMQHKGAVSPEQARNMLCCCFGCGPAFLLGTVCNCLELPREICILLMFSVMLPNLLLGLAAVRRCGEISRKSKLLLHSTDFTAAVETGASAMLKICSMIMIFAALMGMLGGVQFLQKATGLAAALLHCRVELLETACASLLEISNLTEYLRQGGSLSGAAALLSFGGICVHMQNAAIFGGDFPWRKFWAVRVCCAFCTYWLCFAGLHFWGGGASLPVFRQVRGYEPALTQDGILPVLCLILMAVLLLDRHARTAGAVICRERKNLQKSFPIFKQTIDKLRKMRYNKSV